MHKIVLITGGFDPLHSGHLAYINAARSLGDLLVVGVNSDEWLARKKGKPFMPLSERMSIVGALKNVNYVMDFDDSDDSARDMIVKAKQMWPDCHIIFANGGDRNSDNVPEMDLSGPRLSFMFGVGGDSKLNSSSWILKDYTSTSVSPRNWGYYRVLHEIGGETKVKELTVNPRQELSMQRHQYRSEYWHVAEGTATVYTLDENMETLLIDVYEKSSHVFIPKNKWHKLCNEADVPLKIIEIQHGEMCIEEDIERR